jgi:hypothetical protein
MPLEDISLLARFWSKVEFSPECWTWRGAKNPKGYGHLACGRNPRSAHRIAWELSRGTIPSGMFIDHVCRNRTCVNPDHLRLVTPRQNALENSMGMSALNLDKRFCVNGHEGHWRTRPDGEGRFCVECRRIIDRSRNKKATRLAYQRARYHAKKREATV